MTARVDAPIKGSIQGRKMEKARFNNASIPVRTVRKPVNMRSLSLKTHDSLPLEKMVYKEYPFYVLGSGNKNRFSPLFSSHVFLGFFLHPTELSLQGLRVVLFPVVFHFVPPIVVDSWINVALQAGAQVVVPGLSLDLDLQL